MQDDKHREIRINCECSHPLHFIHFNYDVWKYEKLGGREDEEFTIFFCSERIGGFWRRLGRALKYVFWSQDLVTADIVTSREKMSALVEFLNEALAEKAA